VLVSGRDRAFAFAIPQERLQARPVCRLEEKAVRGSFFSPILPIFFSRACSTWIIRWQSEGMLRRKALGETEESRLSRRRADGLFTAP